MSLKYINIIHSHQDQNEMSVFWQVFNFHNISQKPILDLNHVK